MTHRKSHHDRCMKLIRSQERKASLQIRKACTVVEIGDILIICSGKVKILRESMKHFDLE